MTEQPTITIGRRIAIGRTAEVFAWGDKQVLKLFYEWVPKHWVEKEFQISQILAKSDIPAVCAESQVTQNGRMGLVFPFVQGVPMLREMMGRPWKVKQLARRMARLHASVHQLDVPALDRVQTWLHEAIYGENGLSLTQKTHILQGLAALPAAEKLLHCDFHPDQIMLDGRNLLLLDWMNANKGAPAADVARTWLMLSIGQTPDASKFMMALISTFRRTLLQTYLEEYLRCSPQMTLEDIESWILPMAAARLIETGTMPHERPRLFEMIQHKLAGGNLLIQSD